MSKEEQDGMKLYNAWITLTTALNTCAQEINNLIDEREDLRKQLAEARKEAEEMRDSIAESDLDDCRYVILPWEGEK